MSFRTGTMPISEHFKLTTLAEGVFVAIATPSGGAGSNAGIIDLGDHTLVFDAMMTSVAAEDLKNAAEQLTGQVASFVINSHSHSDHVGGNQVFGAQTPIISTHKTRAAIPAATAYMKELKADHSGVEKELKADEERLEKETVASERARLTTAISRQRYILASISNFELRLPDQTFEGELTFYGTQRQATLTTKGKGHTDSDAYLALAEEHILFMGDLGFFAVQPFIATRDLAAWVKQLEGFEASNFEVFVPGHGPVGTKADIILLRKYLIAIDQLITQAMAEGKPVEDALLMPLPAPFDAWVSSDKRRFERNVRTLFQRQK
jgi:cyclase